MMSLQIIDQMPSPVGPDIQGVLLGLVEGWQG